MEILENYQINKKNLIVCKGDNSMKNENEGITLQHIQDMQEQILVTAEELQKLKENKLIPEELADVNRRLELHKYLEKNKKFLHEQHQAFEICDGICFFVKSKEIGEWEKETANASQFNDEEKKLFLDAIGKMGQERRFTRKEIVTLIEEIRKPTRSKTFRQAGEIVDNKLDRSLKNEQTFFDLEDKKEKNIKECEKPTIRGLDLDTAEDKILQTLSFLLHKHSENSDQKSPNYYMGNHSKGLMCINSTEIETARLVISPHEFYSKYYENEKYGSNHIKFLLSKIDALSKKMFLTAWKFPSGRKNKKGEPTYNMLRTNLPLFQIALINEDLSEIEYNEIMSNDLLLEGKKCQFLFKFQPQFTRNIRDRYVEIPEDISSRINKIIGKDRRSETIQHMRDFLLREKQAKRYDIPRDKETIIDLLKLDKFWKEGRKKKVNDKIQECFDIFMKLGLLIGWQETKGKLGQDQYNIKINPNFK